MNPCPCGHLGDPRRDCRCPDQRVAAYRSRVSGPLADRFDLRVEVPRADAHGAPGEPSDVVAGRVAAARELLDSGRPRLAPAAEQLLAEAVERAAPPARRPRAGRPRLAPAAEQLLAEAVERLALSARGRERVCRVAGTIAALGARECADTDDVAEALAYRLELTA